MKPNEHTLTFTIETAPPCDIEIMEQMGWELIAVGELKGTGIETAFFMTTIED
jgi:hypothetical protein